MKLINGIWRPAVTVYCDGYAPASQIKVEGFTAPRITPSKNGHNDPPTTPRPPAPLKGQTHDKKD